MANQRLDRSFQTGLKAEGRSGRRFLSFLILLVTLNLVSFQLSADQPSLSAGEVEVLDGHLGRRRQARGRRRRRQPERRARRERRGLGDDQRRDGEGPKHRSCISATSSRAVVGTFRLNPTLFYIINLCAYLIRACGYNGAWLPPLPVTFWSPRARAGPPPLPPHHLWL